MSELERMLNFAMNEGTCGPYSCAAAVAAALPPDCNLRKAYDYFEMLPRAYKCGAAKRPAVAARLVAMRAKCPRASARDSLAWGIINTGERSHFALRVDGRWYARGLYGVVFFTKPNVTAAWGVV